MNKGLAFGVAAATGSTVAAVAMPWSEIFTALLGAGGVPPALFLLIVGGLAIALAAVASVLKREQQARDTEREAKDKQISELQEKNMATLREALTALERTGTALTTHTTALEARTVTLNELVKGVDNFARNEEANRKYFEEVGRRLEAGIANILERMKG